jgi:protein CWC15
MTTAHRPTWNPSTGGKDQGGNRVMVPTRQYSSKDLPGHTVLKYRQAGQGTADELQAADFKKDLLRREQANTKSMKDNSLSSEESSESEESDQESVSKIAKVASESEADSASENSDDSSDSEFSEEELRKEILKIKAERAEASKLHPLAPSSPTPAETAEVLRSNPLLCPGFALKRKWTEETIFRNQSRDEPTERQRFVNDTVRSDFHRKVLRRYIL